MKTLANIRCFFLASGFGREGSLALQIRRPVFRRGVGAGAMRDEEVCDLFTVTGFNFNTFSF